MDVSVRSIFLYDGGFKPALCFRGRKIAHCVINGETIVRCIGIELHDHDRAPSIPYAGDTYPANLFKSRMLEIANRKGITQRAKMLLETMTVDQDADLPPDDPVQQTPPERGTTTQSQVPSGDAGVNGSSGRHQPAGAGGKDELVTQRKGQPPKRSKPPALSEKREAAAPKPKLTNSRKNASSTRASGAAADRGRLVHQLATEVKMSPVDVRIRLRAGGMKAPYDDLDKMRKAFKAGHAKVKAKPTGK